jgi:SAM-dependent methyltransferase
MANEVRDNGKILILDIMGGCPMVVDPQKPHLGGNMNGGDSATDFSTDLFPWLVKTFSIESLIDVGCAQGHALHAFRALGVKKLLGIEGLKYNADFCKVPVVVHDLTKGPHIVEGYDFVWCSDVAEHIEEQFVDNLLLTLANGKILAMAQGGPNMGHSGWHHVNNQPESYWIEKLKSVGMETDVELTEVARRQTNRGIWPEFGRIYRNVRNK